MNTKTKTKAAGPATKGLEVTAKREGFRRAGIAFGSQATVLPLSTLTDDQVEALKGESMLIVKEVDVAPAEG